VLIGSTETMGVGTNVQARAIAMHHLDAPWRPADIEQRDGRIRRQGNQNPEVQVFRYVTEGSFDTYMWQTLERKAAFIAQVTRGDLPNRDVVDGLGGPGCARNARGILVHHQVEPPQAVLWKGARRGVGSRRSGVSNWACPVSRQEQHSAHCRCLVDSIAVGG
jgi:hypothetical protein